MLAASAMRRFASGARPAGMFAPSAPRLAPQKFNLLRFSWYLGPTALKGESYRITIKYLGTYPYFHVCLYSVSVDL